MLRSHPCIRDLSSPAARRASREVIHAELNASTKSTPPSAAVQRARLPPDARPRITSVSPSPAHTAVSGSRMRKSSSPTMSGRRCSCNRSAK
eukprot:scaffold319769_cov26-Tisochrysis_lutea.AAC.3